MVTETDEWVLLLSFGTLIAFFALVFIFWFTWWYKKRVQGVSPYTGFPLRRASEISYDYAKKIVLYLRSYHMYDNRPFKLRRASFCRETGRIFPDSINWFNLIYVDWNFLQKRYPGQYVSWGSLNDEQQKSIREVHESLEGYQTEFSCPEPSPRAILPEFLYTQPGPLYVDINTKIILGWKVVPDTELEVLIVQMPKK